MTERLLWIIACDKHASNNANERKRYAQALSIAERARAYAVKHGIAIAERALSKRRRPR